MLGGGALVGRAGRSGSRRTAENCHFWPSDGLPSVRGRSLNLFSLSQ